MKTKRLRVFAGPNGSGKSTLKQHITGKFAARFSSFKKIPAAETT